MKCIDRVSFPLYPTSEQYLLMLRNCYNARFAYNWGVAIVREYLNRKELPPSRYTMANDFNRFKKQPGNEWLINNHASQRATKYALTKQLDSAMQKYLKERRHPPAFKTKKTGARMSYYTHEETIKFIIKFNERRFLCVWNIIFSCNPNRKFRRYYIKSIKNFERSRFNCSRRY